VGQNTRCAISAYTHRVAISNHRLVALDDGNVTFRWRDSAHGNRKRLMTLPVDEFLRRFLLHLLPRGFVRIRNFGFLANRRPRQPPTTMRPVTEHTGASRHYKACIKRARGLTFWKCPHCGGEMKLVERFTAAQIQVRAPPALCRGAA
jgi:hypothetical protein